MAWTRLGVPPEWAQYLIQLDLDGSTTVRLPISQHTHDHNGTKGQIASGPSARKTSSSRLKEAFHKVT